ncbi:hypothetical protein LJB94_02375, partial [Odoribacter sp. OttesenSCG-928-G04]|nr:hypothetical protein [Odoribacter sp. OttesenSCG-928-G04]
MNRFILTLGMMIVLLGTTQLKANNIHISRNLSLDIANMTTTSVKVSFALQWENSWRDDFNWDAAYVFLKYRLKGTHNWNQVYLRNGYHTVSDGYDWWLANTNGEGKENAQGIFIYRNKNGVGTADVDVSIHWNYSANGLSKTQLNEGDVEYTAMCIEMVYVPNGAFYLGDNYSNRTFQASYKPIPERLDIIKNDGTMTFDGDALANTDDFLNYPPSNAANRINMSGTSKENAWYSSQTKNGYWQVQFKEPKTIRYFGLSGISNVAAPTKWELYGGNSHATVNELLYSGTNVEWPADANNSYPVSMALKIEHPGSYLIYRIKIVE